MIGSRAFTALMVGWLLTNAVQAEPRPGDIAGVYPSAAPGDRTLYAIARVNPGAGPATTRSGESIIQVFVTGRDRRVEGTSSHYFTVPRDVSTGVRLDALHSAPGPNHFIQIDGREYALQRIMVGVREGRLRLEGAVLVRTGFLPRDNAWTDQASTRLGPEPRRDRRRDDGQGVGRHDTGRQNQS